MESYQNQTISSYQNGMALYPSQSVESPENKQSSSDSYHKKAAESFFLEQLRKLEMERALWKKDEAILTKDISRLNDRIQSEVERRTDFEFEKASLQEELDAVLSENNTLRHRLNLKNEEVDSLRLQIADLQNQMNVQIMLQQHQLTNATSSSATSTGNLKSCIVASSATGRTSIVSSVASRSSSVAPKMCTVPLLTWADKCKEEDEDVRRGGRVTPPVAPPRVRRTVTEPESDFATSSRSSFDAVATSPSSSEDDECDKDGNPVNEYSEEVGVRKKNRKSSTLTRKKEMPTSSNKTDKDTNSDQDKYDEVQDDLNTLKKNIHLVNQKMERNDLEISKLENCVQSLAVRREKQNQSDSS